jgi:hypothetical protein
VPNPCIVWKRDDGSIVTVLEPAAGALRLAKHALGAVLRTSLPLHAAMASATPAPIARAAALRASCEARMIGTSKNSLLGARAETVRAAGD